MQTILLTLIFLLLLLDFYLKHDKIIKWKFEKKQEKGKPNLFHIKKRGAWDKAIEDLKKEFNSNK